VSHPERMVPLESYEEADSVMSEDKERRGTTTASFGTGARESHDSSAFYARFVPPVLSEDETVVAPGDRPFEDSIFHGTAQDVLADDASVADNSVALVVTSPPYFVGKDYEEAMGQGHVPAAYEDHLASMHEVFGACVHKLEPGGRIAVNVANLGRKPYRSQAADIIRIFEDLGLLVRGEIIWKKGEGMNSSTAWGSFQKPSNPVLRDLTERIIVASKGRFGRAISSAKRRDLGLPSAGSIFKEEFMSATKDVWEIPAESATRVGHPAPFPVGLPKRLIDLYTYYDDLILDPYMGAGTTAVAAVRSGRRYVGCETEMPYIDISNERVTAERARLAEHQARLERFRVIIPASKNDSGESPPDDPQARAIREGQKAEDIARIIVEECGFTGLSLKKKALKCGVVIDLVAQSADGAIWHFDVTGSFTSERDGLRRTDTLWKSLGKAAARQFDAECESARYVFLTTSLPESGAGLKALRACQQGDKRIVFDAIAMLSAEGQQRLQRYAMVGIEADPPDSIGPAEPEALF
jgi:DNA modification methylase